MTRVIITTFCLLLMSVAGMAEEKYSLTYEGYPYKKTMCEEPTYAEGAKLTLSAGKPKEEGKVFLYWSFDGRQYQPAQKFTMPGKDVVLVAVWGDDEAVENVQHSDAGIQKILHNGQLMIVRDGKMYTVTGVEITN